MSPTRRSTKTPDTPSASRPSTASLGWLVLLWIAVPTILRAVVLVSQSLVLGKVFWVKILLGLMLGGIQDLMIAFQLVLLTLLVAKLLGNRRRLAAAIPCALFFAVHAYLLFDYLMYRGVGLRMDISYLYFLRDAGPFLDSAIDSGLVTFGIGLLVLAGVSAWCYRFFDRHVASVRLGAPTVVSMALAAVLAVGTVTHMPPDLMYCMNNAVFSAEVQTVRTIVGADELPPIEGVDFASLQKVVPFSQAEIAEYPDPDYPLFKITHGFTGPKQFEIPIAEGERPHVVFLVMESFRANDVGALGGAYGASPNFDRLAGQGVLFSNFYSCGVQTTRAVIGTLFGVPARFDPRATQSHESDLPMIGIADLFRQRGYATAYFHNGSLEFECKNAFFPCHGYDHVWGEMDLAKRVPDATRTSWGIHDEYLMPWVVDWIEQQDRQGTPTFTTAFTVTNHHPWGAPPGFVSPDFPVADPVYKAYLESFHYSDHCLGMFVDLLRQRGLAEKTILFILADTSNPMGEHYNNHVLVHYCYEENVRIPLLILAPGRIEEGVVIDDLGSQMDLLPTVMDLFGMSGPNHAIGTSLVRKVPDRIAYFSNPVVRGHLGLRHGNFKFLFRADTKTSALYDLARDPGEEHNLASQLPKRTAVYQYQVRALTQLMDELFEQRRVVPAGATP